MMRTLLTIFLIFFTTLSYADPIWLRNNQQTTFYPQTGYTATNSLVEISNEFVGAKVLPQSGEFSIYTTSGIFNISTDDNKKLLFERWGNFTSFTTVRVDDNEYKFGGEKGETTVSGFVTEKNTVEVVWQVVNISIKQKIQLVKNQTNGNEDVVKITYSVTNIDKIEHQIALRIVLDTLFDRNDGGVFRIPNGDVINTDTMYEKNKMPEYWYGYNSTTTPSIAMKATSQIPDCLPADQLVFSNYRTISDSTWDIQLIKGREFREGTAPDGKLLPLDSAFAVFWDPRPVSPEETITCGIFFGPYDPNIIENEIKKYKSNSLIK